MERQAQESSDGHFRVRKQAPEIETQHLAHSYEFASTSINIDTPNIFHFPALFL